MSGKGANEFKRFMKICIMGTPVHSGNRGVLALGASLVRLCRRASKGGEIRLLLINRDNHPASFRVDGEVLQVPVVNARLSPKSRFKEHLFGIFLLSVLYRLVPLKRVRQAIANASPWIKTVSEADLVGDVRGGDSFSDIYGMQRFVFGFLTAWSVLLVKGDMVQFPQTYGPFKSPIARWMARFLLKRSSCVVARDTKSRDVARNLLGTKREVLLSPDVAFSLEVVEPDEVELEPPPTNDASGKILGLNVNGLMYNGGYTRNNMFGLKMDYPAFLKELVPALLKEHHGELWLIPHTFAPQGNVESDPEACSRLLEELPEDVRKRVRVVAREYDQHEIKGVIGKCDFFIGSRMHACIAALSQGIPCVGVAYSMKFAGVFESVGVGDWVVDGRSADNAEAVNRVLELYRRREEVREELARRAGEARAELEKVFDRLVTGDSVGAASETREKVLA